MIFKFYNNGMVKLITQSNIQKFIKNVTITKNDCWEWQGYKDRDGYGRLHCNETKKQISAHRFIYEFVKDIKLSKNIFICHNCDNSSCVNPNHLWEGTHEDNMKDMVKKGRGFPGRSNWKFLKE